MRHITTQCDVLCMTLLKMCTSGASNNYLLLVLLLMVTAHQDKNQSIPKKITVQKRHIILSHYSNIYITRKRNGKHKSHHNL